MVIEKPEYLLFLILVIPMGVHYYFSFHAGKNDLLKIGGKWRFESLYNIFVVKHFFIFLFFLLSFIFSVLSLSDFKWGEKLVEDNRTGYDIVLCMDISLSMKADDILPDRLGRAAEVAAALTDQMWNSRFAVVIFKGRAVRVWPLTDDLEAVRLFLDTINPDLITTAGTDIGDALDRSLASFGKGGRHQVIVLFTDGETVNSKSGRSPVDAAKKAREMQIPIITVACGTEKGSKIFIDNKSFVTDSKGNNVVSKTDKKLLATIASVSNGRFYELKDAMKIIDELPSIATGGISDENLDRGLRLEKNEGYHLFLYFSICFLLLSVITRSIRWRDRF